jgi:hypothetical protein
MGDSWFCWLDTLDDDYAVISKRADRIVNEDIYIEAFEYGSLCSYTDIYKLQLYICRKIKSWASGLHVALVRLKCRKSTW